LGLSRFLLLQIVGDTVDYVGSLIVTAIAYTAIAVLVGWWFWRTQTLPGGTRWHGVVSVVFGLLWPIAILWWSLVRLVTPPIHALALKLSPRRRMASRKEKQR
jgi:hypothetical protein